MGEQLNDRSLQGKVALVAGATRGAGRAIAVELCRAGAFVYATGRSSRVTWSVRNGSAGDHRGNRRYDARDRR